MSSTSQLKGAVLVDCARANAMEGVAIASERCGYGGDTETFQSELKSACADMGVSISDLSDLLDDIEREKYLQQGIEIAPDSPDEL